MSNKILGGIVLTREDIYRASIEHYRGMYPKLDAYEIIASRLSMTPKSLYAKVSGERHFTVLEEEQFFSMCNFPDGFDMKRDFVFHPTNPRGKK